MIKVQRGTFQMGCTDEQNNCNNDEKPIHKVRVDGFKISKYEITNQQYAQFLNEIEANKKGHNLDQYLKMDGLIEPQIKISNGEFEAEIGKENYPVFCVTWYGAKAFCEHNGGRLPTEAEWKYAARGGNRAKPTKFAGSNNIVEVSWYYQNSSNKNNNMHEGKGTHKVGTKTSNELGIYNMSGNVAEWCYEWYDKNYYQNSPKDNPQGASYGSYHVIRGEHWGGSKSLCRVSARSHPFKFKILGSGFYGFRICMD
jgi:formylglycine-generating enzyme required for sulfatase activity